MRRSTGRLVLVVMLVVLVGPMIVGLAFVRPALARPATLLETWVWFELGGSVALSELREHPAGVVRLKKGQFGGRARIDNDTSYKLVDGANCVIRQSMPSSNSQSIVYLNNFLPTLQIITAGDGAEGSAAVAFSISSTTRTHCVREARGTLCFDTIHYHAVDGAQFGRMQVALRQIFSKFCSYQGGGPRRATGAAWTTIVK